MGVNYTLQKHHYGIILAVIIVITLLIPLPIFEKFAEDATQKLSILQMLIKSLVSAAQAIVAAIGDLIG